MKNSELAIVHCVHHKEWLIASTVISTFAQHYKDFDTYFLINKGGEQNLIRSKFEEDYEEFYKIQESNIENSKSSSLSTAIKGTNAQLDSYDSSVEEYCNLNSKTTTVIEFENDHGLDSGAWIKFIRSGRWKEYDNILFIGEGGVLTRPTALSGLMEASRSPNINFITGAQDKRFLPRDRWMGSFASEKVKGEMTSFHNRMIDKTYSIFKRDPSFQKTLDLWSQSGLTEVHNFIPQVWGPNLRLLRFINSRIYNFIEPLVLFKESSSPKVLKNKRLSNINFKESEKFGEVNFHAQYQVGWYGACCNHLISNKFLKKLSRKFEEYSIYDVLDLPYTATALEQIWGLIPHWLEQDLWFTDALHRIRKNFFTYQREDVPFVMERYLNRYYKNHLKVRALGNKIQLNKIYNNNNRLEELPSIYQGG
jgi:hypothetical protein